MQNIVPDGREGFFFSIPYNSNLYPIAVIITIHNIFMIAAMVHTKYNVNQTISIMVCPVTGIEGNIFRISVHVFIQYIYVYSTHENILYFIKSQGYGRR